jgi:hypothetical protein
LCGQFDRRHQSPLRSLIQQQKRGEQEARESFLEIFVAGASYPTLNETAEFDCRPAVMLQKWR